MDVPKVLRPQAERPERSPARNRPRFWRPATFRNLRREKYGKIVGQDVGRSLRARNHQSYQRGEDWPKIEIWWLIFVSCFGKRCHLRQTYAYITSETNEVIRKHFAFKKIHTETSKNQVGKNHLYFGVFCFTPLTFLDLKWRRWWRLYLWNVITLSFESI